MTSDLTRPRRQPPGRRVRLLLATLVPAAVVVAACGATPPSPQDPEAAAPADTGSAQAVVAGTTLLPRVRPTTTGVRSSSGAPAQVVVPSLGVDAPVVPISAPGGVLTPPGDPQVLGWWSAGARPGAAEGSALVTGHTVSTGGGALDDLEQMREGDEVRVTTDRGVIDYLVTSTEVLGKGELAEQAEELFDQSVPGRLVLITCEDWNGVEYLSNVVVTASPAVGAR